MSLKDFLTKQYPAGLTDRTVGAEIKRIDAEAERLETVHWESSAHTDAAALLREDMKILRGIRARLIAGHDALPTFNPDEKISKGDIVIHLGVVWQAVKDFPIGSPVNGKGWVALVGTPPPSPAPIPATIDVSLEGPPKFKKGDTAEEREHYEFVQAVKTRAQNELGSMLFTEVEQKRPPSLRMMFYLAAADRESTQRALSRRDATIEKLVKRIDELESGGIRYHGVWQAAQDYSRGALVTYDGSMWHANQSTTEQPGKSKAWTLAVKAGRDGKESK